jgi:hypothetical protein
MIIDFWKIKFFNLNNFLFPPFKSNEGVGFNPFDSGIPLKKIPQKGYFWLIWSFFQAGWHFHFISLIFYYALSLLIFIFFSKFKQIC